MAAAFSTDFLGLEKYESTRLCEGEIVRARLPLTGDEALSAGRLLGVFGESLAGGTPNLHTSS